MSMTLETSATVNTSKQPQQQQTEQASATTVGGGGGGATAALAAAPPPTPPSSPVSVLADEKKGFHNHYNNEPIVTTDNIKFINGPLEEDLSSGNHHQNQDRDRLESEFDDMARFIGPVAKSLYTPILSPMVDANSFADALGVSPMYKQKESQRWSSALHVYQQMSTHEPPSPISNSVSRASEDEELATIYSANSSSSCDAIVGDFDENLFANSQKQQQQINDHQPHHFVNKHMEPQSPYVRPSAPPPPDSSLTPITTPSRSTTTNVLHQQQQQPIPVPQPQHQQPLSQQPSLPSGVASPKIPTHAAFSPRYGFMTPPARAGILSAGTAVNIISPVNRRSSNVSPGNESSLNSLELEAIAAVHELQFAVKDIFVSEMLPRTSELIFLNVTTLEGQAYCVELTMKGWRVTSLRHDCMNADINYLDLHTKYFETIYALMDHISPDYRQRFTDALSAKLTAIAEAERQQEMDAAADGTTTTTPENNNKKQTDKEVVIIAGGGGADENLQRVEQEKRQTFT